MSLIDRRFRERIILVGVTRGETSEQETEASLDELGLLIATAGADEVARMVQRRTNPDPAYYLGKGKVDELVEMAYRVDADTVVFDDELTPAQQRNLTARLGRTAIDRTAVILDIFAQNASTPEGRAQVELAILRYRLPHLRGSVNNLSQQAGGIGTRGPGETKLETDRRRLLERVTKLERELERLALTRKTQRRSRSRSALKAVSIVGYTNAGKSTLLNQLTNAGVVSDARLFATLDPRVRRLRTPSGTTILCSDTVGFVRKLPHQLIQAFHSTLEVICESDLLVHLVDASNPDPLGQIEAVRKVLDEIDAGEVPELITFNKIDQSEDGVVGELRLEYPSSPMISAKEGIGIEGLMGSIELRLGIVGLDMLKVQ
ncbi:MAG TPA: GTPase HflX [Acidimicrobiales bacterium]|nr:GTPase HflX [Acidimicrobiales bacterium]